MNKFLLNFLVLAAFSVAGLFAATKNEVKCDKRKIEHCPGLCLEKKVESESLTIGLTQKGNPQSAGYAIVDINYEPVGKQGVLRSLHIADKHTGQGLGGPFLREVIKIMICDFKVTSLNWMVVSYLPSVADEIVMLFYQKSLGDCCDIIQDELSIDMCLRIDEYKRSCLFSDVPSCLRNSVSIQNKAAVEFNLSIVSQSKKIVCGEHVLMHPIVYDSWKCGEHAYIAPSTKDEFSVSDLRYLDELAPGAEVLNSDALFLKRISLRDFLSKGCSL